MRITHISPEFQYTRVNGTLSMAEKKSFFGSKLINFDDALYIQNQNIIYYENASNEQINLNLEKLTPAIIYNADNDKQANSSLVINPAQSQSQIINNTSWILSINYGAVMYNYLFAKLKSYRTFEGVTNAMTYNNSVDAAIKDYIKTNLVSRYEFFKVELYLSYNDLATQGGLRYQNNWDPTIQLEKNYTNQFQTKTDSTNMKIDVVFNQSKNSLDNSFNYYYNLYFRKI